MTDKQQIYFCPKVVTCQHHNCACHSILHRKNSNGKMPTGFFLDGNCPKYGIPLDTLVIVTEERELNA